MGQESRRKGCARGWPKSWPWGCPSFRLRHPEGLFPRVPPLLTFYPNDTIVG